MPFLCFVEKKYNSPIHCGSYGKSAAMAMLLPLEATDRWAVAASRVIEVEETVCF